MMPRKETIDKIEKQVQKLLNFVDQSVADGRRIDETERGLFDLLVELGLCLLDEFVQQAGDGDEGQVVEREGRSLKRSHDKQARPYRSIFGVLSVERFVYARGAKKQVEWVPLDARLGMPAGEQSYVLEDWTQRFCIHNSFGEGVQSLRDLLGVKTVVRTAEGMNRAMAQHAESFRAGQPKPPANDEESILVVTADGKGVPMRRPLEERLREGTTATPPRAGDGPRDKQAAGPESRPRRRKRLGRGEKRTRKQMAYVGAVYSIAPFPRGADDILDELRRKRRQTQRPAPKHKRVWAEMTEFREGETIEGQPKLFSRLGREAASRDPEARKTLVCLMDGQRSLWALKDTWLERAKGILDIFHVLERLWKVAHCFHAEKSAEAEQFVDRYLRMLLEGKVGYCIGVFRRLDRANKLKGPQRKTLRDTIRYFDNNRSYMRYDEYLAAGLPIGSGVVEGACRHVVKDRMERTGMRWEIEGAQAMLSLRTIYLNGDWTDFVHHRAEREQEALYGLAG